MIRTQRFLLKGYSVEEFRCISLRSRLTLLVLLAMLPGFLLSFYMSEEGRRYAKIEAFEQARRLALLYSSNGKTLMESGRRMLLTMAQSPVIRNHDSRECNAFFHDILAGNPEFADILAADGTGAVFSSSHPSGRNISVSDR